MHRESKSNTIVRSRYERSFTFRAHPMWWCQRLEIVSPINERILNFTSFWKGWARNCLVNTVNLTLADCPLVCAVTVLTIGIWCLSMKFFKQICLAKIMLSAKWNEVHSTCALCSKCAHYRFYLVLWSINSKWYFEIDKIW